MDGGSGGHGRGISGSIANVLHGYRVGIAPDQDGERVNACFGSVLLVLLLWGGGGGGTGCAGDWDEVVFGHETGFGEIKFVDHKVPAVVAVVGVDWGRSGWGGVLDNIGVDSKA